MANNKCISYGTIFKRSSCLSSVNESVNIDLIGKQFSRLDTQLTNLNGSVTPSIRSSIRSFTESICNTKGASKYFRQPLYIVEKIQSIDKNFTMELVNEFTTRVLPYVEDISIVEEAMGRYELEEIYCSKILEAVKDLVTADRILKNHNRICERFNVELEAKRVSSKGLKSVAESFCSMIDTYSVKPYQKLNLCIEELCFVLNKNGISFDKKDMTKYVTEYFLLREENLGNREIEKYRLALNENYCLEQEDLEKVNYIYQDNIEGGNRIKTLIQRFMLSNDKSLPTVENIVYSSCEDIEEIRCHLNSLLWFLWDVYRSDILDREVIEQTLPVFVNIITRKIEDSCLGSSTLNKGELRIIISKIKDLSNLIIITGNDDPDYCHKAMYYKSTLSDLIKKLESINEIAYPESNINAINYVNSESAPIMSISEFKIFKFNNLVKAAMNLDKYLKEKSKKIYDKGSKKTRHIIRRVKDILFSENVNIYSYIGEDAKVDICVAAYEIHESDMDMVGNMLEETCREFNNKLSIENNTCRAYYIILPGLAELHIKESYSIDLSESDWNLVRTAEDVDLDYYINSLALSESCFEDIENKMSMIESVEDKILKVQENENFTFDHFKLALEALSLLGVSEETINLFAEKFNKQCYFTSVCEKSNTVKYYNEEKAINEAVSNWCSEEDVPFEVQWEAYQILDALLEAAPEVKKPDVNKVGDKKKIEADKDSKKEDKEELKKNPFKGININNIKLYLEGLKTKMKDMSQKEKEVSRNLDNNFRRFVKALHDALISDRREAIIKGSVIPSFSRCIKICISLAGLGLVTGNPLVPLLTAIGGFAVSKRLTQKERILLLDEIETELDVVEKEIGIAESKNQMKKYRTLLKYKKDLQRQYQRIKYNVRVGKDILPGSAAGFREK